MAGHRFRQQRECIVDDFQQPRPYLRVLVLALRGPPPQAAWHQRGDQGGVIAEDSRFCDLFACKRYTDPPDRPRVEIRIRELTAADL